MPEKILITGVNGFVGAHLISLLKAKGYGILGLDAKIETDGKSAKPGESGEDGVELIECDLRDSALLEEIVTENNPEIIFHLAAQSSVKLSFENPSETFSINVIGTVNLLEAASNLEKPPKVLLVSSSEIYGQLKPEEVPVKEDAPLKPVNPYAVSKATVDLMAYQYWKAYDLPVYLVRAFSHSGPGQRTVAVLSDWAFQTAKIELGLRPPQIDVGNMDVTRDYMDVRDTVRAYCDILEKGKPGTPYNVCSGTGYKLGDLLDIIISFSSKKIDIVPDPSRLRPVDIPILIGSPAKLKQTTGWQPRIKIEKTLRDLFDYWTAFLTPQMQ